MVRLLLLIGLGILFLIPINAQENPKIEKYLIISKAPDAEKAKKEFATAEKYYKKGKGTYDEALKYYLKLYGYYSENEALNYKIGICYLFSSNKKKSLEYLLKSSPIVAKDYLLALGKAYQYNLMYIDAKNSYKRYFMTLSKWNKKDYASTIQQLERDCDFGEKAIQDSTPVFITNLGSLINTYYDDYGAIHTPWNNSIYFTSKRPEKEPNKRVSRFKFKERILVANNCINEPCASVLPISKLNSNAHMSLAGVDKNTENLFYYKGHIQHGGIYSAKVTQENKAKKMKRLKGKINHIAFKETTISKADDGSTYFISNKRGGEGNKDIWYAQQKGKNRYSKVKNLGNIINTPFDEECIYVTPDGNTLFFSSKGHNGMGGFDVFKSKKTANGNWSKPENLGYPINTPADELFYRPTEDSLVALYSSIRESGFGGLDIYKIEKDTRIPFALSGYLYDEATQEPLFGTVSVYNENEELIASTEVDTLTQKYSLTFEDIGDYSILADSKGYGQVTDTIICPEVRHEAIQIDFNLKKLKFPFTIAGTITDTISGAPLAAEISIFDIVNDSLLMKQITNPQTGYYSMTLADKYNLRFEISSTDYYSKKDSLNSKTISGDNIQLDYQLQSSKIYYNITGTVLEEETLKPVYGAIYIFNSGELLPLSIAKTDSTKGSYQLTVEDKGPFDIEVKAEGYFFANDSCIFTEADSLNINKNYLLKLMITGAKIVVENILFNSGKSTLKPESFKELDKLATLLLENENIRIEVSGHTDNVGSAAINKRISKARALSVMNYLINKGVMQERVEHEGYGFDQPIAPNTTPEGRAQNRRVEIKVLD